MENNQKNPIYKPERSESMKSKLRSANMERANIASSDRAGDLVGEGQARRNPAAQSYPNHLGHPKCHMPRHCHGPPPCVPEEKNVTSEFQSQTIGGIESELEAAIADGGKLKVKTREMCHDSFLLFFLDKLQ